MVDKTVDNSVAKNKQALLRASKNVEATLEKFKANVTPEKTADFIIEDNETSRRLRASTYHAQEQQRATGVELSAQKPSSYYREPSVDKVVRESMDKDENAKDSVLLLTPDNRPSKKSDIVGSTVTFIGIFASVIWISLVVGYIQNGMGWSDLLSQQPHIIGGFFAGIIAPLALVWFILAQFRRRSEIEKYTNALKHELQSVLFPSNHQFADMQQSIAGLCYQAAELTSSTEVMLKDIRKARHGLRQDIEAYESLTSKASNHIDHLSNAIEKRSSRLLSLTDEIEKRTSSIEMKTMAGAQTWDETTSKALNRVTEIESSMKQGLERLLGTAEIAANRANDIGQNLEKTYGTIEEKVLKASASLDNVSEAFIIQQEAFAESTGMFAEDTARLNSLLQEHAIGVEAIEMLSQKSLELMQKIMEDGASQHQMISNRLEESLIEMSTIAEMADEKADKVAAAIGRQAAALKETAENARNDISHLEESMMKRAKEAKKHADEITHQLKDVDFTISERMNVLTAQADKMYRTIKASVSDLDRATSQIEPFQQKALRKVGDTIATLGEGLVQIGGIADSVQDNLDKSSRKFTDSAEKMRSISKEASIAAEQAASVFVNKTKEMHKMVSETTARAEKIQGADRLLRQEMFMGAARFIVESIHSLSVDLTRAIDGGIHESLWNKYQNGDLTIFTSYLVSIKDDIPMDKLRVKFAKENEFRTYVNSFIHQYEDMVEQAMKVDHAALLGATFLSSDIGKLYRLVCQIAGRSPLVSYQEKKSA
ncbi:MAG: hypothetical protein GW903_02965 [Alphaproteobacteria bacterium]|nr:hypothetical protein [Alphaproteobacteria bacterium]NCQ87935.1 hypothetical protein [Alphaproteobacteria bacterium]NCT05558.1 hypothetical protein [Alphaproteobacteria bacterium]